MEINVADLFCGAGGSSTGLAQACEELGVEFALTAVNHWDVVIASHTANHPRANHLHTEVDQLRSRALAAGGRLDILWASPSCTEHSYAKGGHDVDDQGRVSAWAIVREIERYQPSVVFVENVPPFRNWGPIETLPDGRIRPIKERKGETFRAWFSAIESMGYVGKWTLINAADYGEPQTRIRWFGIFTVPEIDVPFPQPTHGKPGTLEVDAGLRQPWVGAREIIDWNLAGTSIFDRARPLAPNTMRRIEEGIRRYCSGALAEAFLVVLRNHSDAQPLSEPSPTVTSGGTHIGLAETSLRPFVGANRTNNVPVDAESPTPPVTTATGGGLFVAEPFVIGQQEGSVARNVDQPLPTVTGGGYTRVFEPFITDVRHGDRPHQPRALDDPIGAVTQKNGVGIVEPFLYGGHISGSAQSLDEPVPTVTAKTPPHRLVEPMIVDYAARDGAGSGKSINPAASVDEPLDTVITRDRFGLAEPFIVPQQNGTDPSSTEDPLQTVTTTSRGVRLIEPFIASYYGAKDGPERVRGIDEPIPTVPTENRFGLVEPFLTAHFGEREGQPPRTHAIDDPLPTVTHRGAGDLVEPVVGAQQGRVVEIDGRRYVLDVRFRMLQPHELAAAQGFPAGYRFTGTKSDQTAQIGNAVPVGVARALVREALIALGFGREVAA